MKHCFAMSAFAVLCVAGSAMADINSINGLNFNSYESFRNPAAVIPSTLTLDGNVYAPAFNGSTAVALGNHNLTEKYAAGTPGFANRHMLWASDNGGASAYQLQAGESFHIEGCFIIRTNHPTGIGAPVNSETGIWMHNPRVNDAGTPFIDEGGVWAITNGTSFSGGAAMDFHLYGEGGFNNPSSPPIIFTGDTIFQSYTYYAPGYFGPNSPAGYEATVSNLTRGITQSSGLLGFGPNQLNPGTQIGFRFQDQVFPVIDTDTSVDLFHVRIIPAPTAAGLLGLGALAMGRRRR